MDNFKYGLASFGIPLPSGGRFSSPWATHYFVDGLDGSDSNDGKSPSNAMKTIQAAVTASAAGDVIYVRPKGWTIGTGFARYTEDVVVPLGGSGGSTGVTATGANKSIIGVTPRSHPTDFLGVRMKFTTATALTIDAPGTHVENIGIFGEGSTYMVNLRNNGTTYTQMGTSGSSFYNCAFKGDGAFYANGTDELQIINCRFQAMYDGTMGGINLVGSSNQCKRPIIIGCEFIGGNANNMHTAPITTAAPVYDLILRDCYFSIATDSGIYINIAGTTNTGLVANCYFASADINAQCTGLVNGSSGVFATGMYDQVGIDDFSS